MPRPSHLILRAFLASACAACCGTVAAASGDMMIVTTTTTFQMEGTRATVPQSTRREICVSKKHDPRDLVGPQANCVMSGYTEIGETVAYAQTCTGNGKFSGKASFVTRHGGGVHGTLHLFGKARGKSTTIDVTYDAAPAGNCDYRPPRRAR